MKLLLWWWMVKLVCFWVDMDMVWLCMGICCMFLVVKGNLDV